MFIYKQLQKYLRQCTVVSNKWPDKILCLWSRLHPLSTLNGMAAVWNKEGRFFRGSDSTLLQLVVAPGMVACDRRRFRSSLLSTRVEIREATTGKNLRSQARKGRLDHTSAIRDQGYVYTLPDSFCAGTKTLPNRASVYIIIRTVISARFLWTKWSYAAPIS